MGEGNAKVAAVTDARKELVRNHVLDLIGKGPEDRPELPEPRRLLEHVVKVGESNPDRYASMAYLCRETGQRCLVGEALAEMAYPIEALPNFVTIDHLYQPWVVFDPYVDTLAKIQSSQDNGSTWGEAVEESRQEIQELLG